MGLLTRKELVLRLLRENEGQWVDGTRIASAEVGGSEGLKRLRELRQDGYDIRMRKHPDPRRDIFQYKLMPSVHDTIARIDRDIRENPRPPIDHRSFGESITYHVPYEGETTVTHNPATTPGMAGRSFPLKRNEDGSVEIEWKVCEDCGGRYAIDQDHLTGEEHRRWEQYHQTIEGHTEIPAVAPPVVFAYTEKPVGLSFGEAVVCPRCKGVRRPKRQRNGKWFPADEMCMDPKDHSIECRRCNGWGLVPNQGPVPTADQRPTKAEREEAPVEEAPTEGAFTDG